jgi:predicted histone-like DNA-binding protein
VYGKTYSLSQLAKELAARSTTASEGDVFSVLIGLRDLMKEHLDHSDRVLFDGIGTFEIALSSEGAEEPGKFHSSLIKSARLNFRPDSEMKSFISGLKYARYIPKA